MIEKLFKKMGPFFEWSFRGSFLTVWSKNFLLYFVCGSLLYTFVFMGFGWVITTHYALLKVLLFICSLVACMPATLRRNVRENREDAEDTK